MPLPSHPVDPERLREDLLRFYAFDAEEHPVVDVPDHSAAFLELPKVELASRGTSVPAVDTDRIEATLGVVRTHQDCADFGLTALLRLLALDDDAGLLSADRRSRIAETVHEFVYWFNDARTSMWFSTENHQVLFAAAELLAGQRYPDERFSVTDRTGRWHRRRARARLERWLDWRLRFGFSEWLSNTYHDEVVAALANLASFAVDESIRKRSRRLLDCTLFDVALNASRGVFGSTHGRTYARHVLDPTREPTSALQALCWGRGAVTEALSRSAVCLATSDYTVPPVVQEAALADTVETRERQSLNVETAADYGVDPGEPANLPFFLGALVMGHRDVVDTAMEGVPPGYTRRFPEVAGAARYHEAHEGAPDYDPDPNNTAMTQVNTYTYRRPEYTLSCAQDFRRGTFGFQHHVWQATLGDGTPVFTNHPRGPIDEVGVDGYWTGNGLLPRAAAHQHVCCCLYDVGTLPHPVPPIPGFDRSLAETPYTHAFVPRYAFDEFVERDPWRFGRVGESYVALASTAPTHWRAPDDAVGDLLPVEPTAPYELVADAASCGWVCELGSRRDHGSFGAFVDAIADAPFEGTGTSLSYRSPSLGSVTFDWDGLLTVDGSTVPLADYPRFDNRFCTTPFGDATHRIRGRETPPLYLGV